MVLEPADSHSSSAENMDGTHYHHGSQDSENTPLLGRPGYGSDLKGNQVWKRVRAHMTVKISKDWADVVLLFCYIITGLLDSCAVFIWGSFVSMQTGNSIYLGLGLVAPNEGVRWIKALTSIAFFCLGSFFFSRWHRVHRPRARWILVSSYIFQLGLITVAALIVTYGGETNKEEFHWQVIVPLGAVAFQSAGQAVTSRVLQYGGLTSVVLTSNYCDLFSDPKLWAWDNAERNRRVAAPILLLFGAMMGGLFAHSSIGLAGALWTAMALKAVAILAWLFWPAEEDEDE